MARTLEIVNARRWTGQGSLRGSGQGLGGGAGGGVFGREKRDCLFINEQKRPFRPLHFTIMYSTR